MKRWRWVLGAILLAGLCMGTSAAGAPVRVVVDGEEVTFTSEQPVILSGRVMLPLREVAMRLGAEAVRWDPETQTAAITYAGRIIRLRVGRPWATVDRAAIPMETAPILRAGRMFVPLRSLAETLGATVHWLPQERTAVITVPQTPR
ncbi:MAG TPA: copper amine oxidase N-terminal domain-containing protein [Armatimonadetes bacterium]|jgi:hypothetical protein|nr:copper amine oxidase N-terminal domain-containing protein [Armatimonadota bacterium]